MATVKSCACDARMQAVADGTFGPRFDGLWVRLDAKLRAMSKHALYYAYVERQDYKHPDHSGEPFTFQCCPWCGADLPGLYPDAPTRDVGEGEE